MRVTDKYVFFWRENIAQWNMTNMTDPIDGLVYNCCEQYMMAQKAKHFGDMTSFSLIMATRTPKEQKDLGRLVKNFDPVEWDKVKEDIVYRGNWMKFTQNPKLMKELMKHGQRIFVEASPYDLVWGVGYGQDDPEIEDVDKWRGQNLLGWTLTDLRDDILKLMGVQVIG